MRAMAEQFFQGTDLLGWPLLTLILFIAVFAIAIVRVVRRGAGAFDEVARLPLDQDQEGQP